MPGEFIAKNFPELLKCVFPGFKLNILECDGNHRIPALVCLIGFSGFPDRFIPEIHGSVFIRYLKEDPEHIHVQRLAETTWTCKKRYHGTLIQEIPDHEGLIHIIVLRGCDAVIGYTNRKRQFFLCSCSFIGPGPDSFVGRTFCVLGNIPQFSFFYGSRYFPFTAHSCNMAFRKPPADRGIFCTYHNRHEQHFLSVPFIIRCKRK